MAGLFGTFTTALRGLSVQQTALSTTSHNIANASTEGYSRQRAIPETTRPFGGMSRFDTSGVGQIGTGAEISAIDRVRDQFIDYQIRSEAGTSGYYNSMSETLAKIDGIFGEPSDTSIQQLVNNFFNVFQGASTVADKSDIKALAIKKAEALANALNYTYNKLEKSCEECQTTIQNSVLSINSTLNKINELNKQIRSVSAVGQKPNDLMDKRDNYIDELSYKFGIKVDRDNFETINLYSTEYQDPDLNVTLVKSNPNDTDYNRFSYVKSVDYIKKPDGTYDVDADGVYKGITVEYYPLGNEKAAVKKFDITMAKTAILGTDTPAQINDKVSADNKQRKDLMNNLIQNRMLIADKNGNVGKVVESTPTPLTPVPTPPPISPKDNGDGTTTVTGVAVVGTVTTTTMTTSPTIETFPSTTTVTVIVSDSASPPATATQKTIQKLEPQTADEVKARIFVSYKQESDSTGKLVNNVDINHIKGDIAANQSIQEKLRSYMDSLNRLAAGLAYSVNAIQTGSIDGATTPNGVDGTTSNGLDNNLIFVTYNETTKKNDTTDVGITAKNLRINADLLGDARKLNFNTTSSSGDGDGKRAKAFGNINTLKMNFSNVVSSMDLTKMTRKDFLTQVGINTAVTGGFTDATCLDLNDGTDGSTVDSYYRTIINNFAVDSEEATTTASNEEARLADLKNQRLQVSGVSLDEEMANMIQFQHAYQANAKMIATIDELLDVVINGLKK